MKNVLKELGVKYSMLRCIRICLGTDGTAMYWPFFQDDDDYSSSPMDPEDALHEITGRGVPIEVACQDPQDEQPHNYEILQSNGESTSSSVQLQRI